MASVRQGDTIPVFGLAAETIGSVQEFTSKRVVSKATVENHEGETIAVAYYNPKFEGTIKLIKSEAGGPPAFAVAALTLANFTDAANPVIAYEFERKPEQKGFESVTITWERWESFDPE
jgi:hypothetical protein